MWSSYVVSLDDLVSLSTSRNTVTSISQMEMPQARCYKYKSTVGIAEFIILKLS